MIISLKTGSFRKIIMWVIFLNFLLTAFRGEGDETIESVGEWRGESKGEDESEDEEEPEDVSSDTNFPKLPWTSFRSSAENKISGINKGFDRLITSRVTTA